MSKRRWKKGALVFVSTRDIEHEHQGWLSVKSVRKIKPLHFAFVGWVVKDTKRYVQVTPAVDPKSGKLFCVYRLPKSPGIRITRLRWKT